MKKIIALAALLIFIFESCSTDFELTTDWKDITIVYGLLDKDANYNYIRIEKAFLDKEISALTLAQNADSLYYDSLTVQLLEYDNGSLLNTTTLEKVDGDNISATKDSGIFAQSPNILYRTDHAINQNYHYQLLITKPDDQSMVSAETNVINDFSLQKPIGTQKINFFPGGNYTFEWKSATDGKIYDLLFRFHYKEYDNTTGTLVKDTVLNWQLFRNKTSGSTAGGEDMGYIIESDNFYNFLSNSIADNQDVYRVAGKVDLIFSVGGEEFYNYYLVNQAQTGLTQGQSLQQYTNINPGYGIFSSRMSKTFVDKDLTSSTIDSLSCMSLTSHLNFLRANGTPCQ